MVSQNCTLIATPSFRDCNSHLKVFLQIYPLSQYVYTCCPTVCKWVHPWECQNLTTCLPMIFCQETQSSGNSASSKMAVRLPSLDILCGPWKMIKKSSTFTFSSSIQDDQAKEWTRGDDSAWWWGGVGGFIKWLIMQFPEKLSQNGFSECAFLSQCLKICALRIMPLGRRVMLPYGKWILEIGGEGGGESRWGHEVWACKSIDGIAWGARMHSL